jgi:AsmA protein
MKKLGIILAGVIVVLFLALLFVPQLINWNGYKPKIAAMVKESTGRELRIDGDIELAIFPNLVFSLSGVHLSNAPGMQAPEMLSLGSMSGKVRLLPLLMRRVVVDSFVVQEPSVHLEVDKNGRANWEFASAGQPSPAPQDKPSDGKTGLPISGLSLGDVRLSRGNLSMTNAVTGQTIVAKDVDLTAALADLGSPFTLALRLNLNDEPVTVDLSVDSPRGVLEGPAASVQAAVTAKYLTTNYQGKLQQQPVPGLDGTFNLDIPSVGQLAAWLGRPLDRAQPDPGPLKVRAVFQGDGKTVALSEASIDGKAMHATATGRFDGSGDITRITLNVESDTLDVDRYLPPPATTKTPAPQKVPTGKTPSKSSGDIMAVFSTEPLDLSVLRKTEADVRIAMRGIKAMGYDIGQVDFTTNVQNGRLTAAVNKLELYGGNVNGTLKLDASGKALDVNAALNIDRVKVDKLAKAASGDGGVVTGIASGNIQATANGESPRRLVESLKGGLSFDLGGVDVQQAPAGSLSELKVNLDLPGIDQAPSFQGRAVYNKQPVTVALSTDPLRRVLSSDAFALKASVDSPLVRLGYDGKVQQRPVPGLDGSFNLDIPSVGKLAAWVGQPLDPSQPDPGSLKVQAVFQGDGARVVLKTATIEGQALKASASGSYDGSGDIAKITLKVDSERLDIDRYLPAPAAQKAPPPRDATPAPSTGNPLAALSETPFDLGPLKKTDVEAHIALGGIRAKGYQLGRTVVSTTLKNGLLTTDLQELNLYNGNVKGTFKLDASGKTPAIDTVLTLAGVKVGELVQTATAGKVAAGGTASGDLKVNAQGGSPKALAESMSAKVAFTLGGVDIKDAKASDVSELNLALDMPGLTKPFDLTGRVVYKKEPVQVNLKLDSIQKALVGDPFAVNTAVTSKMLNLAYDGTLQQQPATGLDGTLHLEVPSVAQLLQWVDHALPQEQPDPGPVKLRAVFAAKAAQTALKEASISGKALQVHASGSMDRSGPTPVVMAKVRVEHADMNAYLPPPEPSKTSAAKPTPEAQPQPAGWSEEPLNLSVFSMANADIDVKIDSLRYRDLTIKPGHMRVTLKNGVLNATLDPLNIADGTIASTVHVDAANPVVNLDYHVAIAGLPARPLLKTLANNDRLSGNTTFQLKGTGKGKSQKDLVRSLNGNGQFTFLDGAIHGINLAATLRQVKTLGLDKQAAETQQTDFAELSGSFVITNGVVENKDLKMLAPLVRLSGGGLVPLPAQAIDYDLTATLVATLKGQGGKDAMAGLPIPIKVKGPWANIAYNVNWDKAFKDVAADPERLKNLPQDVREASKNLGINLPLPKLPDTGTGDSPLKQLDQLKQLLKDPTAPAPSPEAPQPAPKEGTKQTEEKPSPAPKDPLKTLKDIFKR